MLLFDLPARPAATLLDVLDFQAAENGAAVWLREDDRQVTFAEAKALVDRYAAGFAAEGLSQGQTIAMVVAPGIEVVLVALGAARCGAIFTTLSTDFKGDFLHGAVNDTLAELLIIDGDLAERWEPLRETRIRRIFVNGPGACAGMASLEDLRAHGTHKTAVSLSAVDPVQVWWSSGTTGKSKGVIHGHSSILRFAYRLCSTMRAGDVLYACTPIYLGSAWTSTIWPSLLAGICGAIDRRFSASQFWERIIHYDATHFFTLGAMHMHLWKRPPAPTDRLHRVRVAYAIPLSWDLVPEFKARFGIARMSQAYGTSETFMIFEAPDDGTQWRGAALGRPLEIFEVKLFDENDREVPLGEAGEICVRPKEPGVMFLGYFNQAEVTVKSCRNLWYHTGDMGICDEDGIYYFADRKKDYIRYNGRNISMFEVEAVIGADPNLADVCAYGIESEELATEAELCIAVVPKPNAKPNADDIARYINLNAPYYFVPRYILIVDELPRNAHGRLLKNELRAKGLPADVWDRKKNGFAVER